jgi:hypothetical protein
VTSTKPSLEKFLAKQDDQLAALRVSSSVELDFSYESIDRLEVWFSRFLDSKPTEKEREQLESRVVRYIGETSIDHTTGSWRDSDDDRPAIRVPNIAHRMFEPVGAVLDFRRLRRPGLLRDYTECWDLPLRRVELARLWTDRERELATLADEVAESTGDRVTPSGDEATLLVVETALRRSLETGAAIARLRAMRNRVELLLGESFMRATGSADCAIEDRADHANFGQFVFGGWSPHTTVLAIGTGSTPGRLFINLTLRIQARRRGK